MMGLFGWLDDRTGYKQLLHEALYENIPGGSRWRYVTGSMLVFAFATQAITGIFLWMCYSPGSQNAWESVYYIQNEMQGGWLLRGIHHFMAQAMVVLLPVHMLQVIWDKAYRAPREINFWLGLVLMLITLGLSLTGYLLPWDQKGYWATKVATNLMSLAPGGQSLQKLVVGGSDYGHFTLTRFFGLHAGVLPALLVFFLALHIAMFRKHGITAEPSATRADQHFWPYQVLKDGLACLALLLVVLLACVHFDVVGVFTGLPEEHRGAHLSAPADAVEEYKAARPEWYFLFLFQLLKYFEESEFIGAIVIPGAIVGFLFLMPLLGRWELGHKLNVAVFLLLFAGAGYLTAEALYFDNYESFHSFDETKYAELDQEAKEKYERPFKAAREYHEAVEGGHREYERVKDLITFYGIPRSGAVSLQRSDPETVGPRLFRRNCASCHSYLDAEGVGIAGPDVPEGVANGAPNLYQFAGRTWIDGLLDPEKVAGPDYFGNTAHAEGDMVSTVVDSLEFDEAQRAQAALALSYEAKLVYQAEADAKAEADGSLAAGRELLENNCSECHNLSFVTPEEGTEFYSPDLAGYGSYKWLRDFIANPEHASFYPDSNDRMPAFAADPENPDKNLLTEREIDLLVRWIRGDDRDLELKLEQMRAAEEAKKAPAQPPEDAAPKAGKADEPEAGKADAPEAGKADEPKEDENKAPEN